MKKKLTIDLSTLPEEGKPFSGELDSAIFTANISDLTPESPLAYDLYLQKFDNELLIRGNLSATFQFTCDRCLNTFRQTIEANDCNLCIETTGSQLDLTDSLREEIIIMLPDYPHCEDADPGEGPEQCILDSRYLAVDKPPVDDVKTPPRGGAPNPWDALNAIKGSDTEPS